VNFLYDDIVHSITSHYTYRLVHKFCHRSTRLWNENAII